MEGNRCLAHRVYHKVSEMGDWLFGKNSRLGRGRGWSWSRIKGQPREWGTQGGEPGTKFFQAVVNWPEPAEGAEQEGGLGREPEKKENLEDWWATLRGQGVRIRSKPKEGGSSRPSKTGN